MATGLERRISFSSSWKRLMKMTDNMLSTNTSELEESNRVLSPLLPRSAWNSQVSYLRVLFKVKKALDRIEQEANVRESTRE